MQWPNEEETMQWPNEGQTTQWPNEGQTIQWPNEKGQTTIHKTLHRKLRIEQHEPY